MIKNEQIKRLIAACLGIVASLLVSCAATDANATRSKGSQDYLQATQQDMQDWRDMKFGISLHWSPVSLMGTEMSWSRAGGRGGWPGNGTIPVEVYDNLYKSFYPAQFDAKQWVAIAKNAGMKYLIYTAKHHDGFCMFDTSLTDYKITNSPFKRDVVKELADACHQGGLKFGIYYSQPDWRHSDYHTENHACYIKYLHGHLQELCSNYGKVDIICFDGLSGAAKDWDSENLFKMIRQLQPHVIINNRAGLPADYDTPEQNIGLFQTDRPWESWITLGDQWSWKSNDQIKSLKECIQTLVKVAGSDGNFNLSIGPMPTGEIEPRQVTRLKEIGHWLAKYGQSIYSTRGGPFKTGSWGTSTHKDNTIYLHILSWDNMPANLPPIGKKIISAELLSGGTVNITQDEKGITVSVPPQYRSEIDTIIKLQLDGPASDIAPAAVSSGSLAAHKTACASNILKAAPQHGADKAFDDDLSTCWTTDECTSKAWLEVDLGEPVTFDRVMIHETGSPWALPVEKFELQYKKDDQWVTFLQGAKIGSNYRNQFEPVTARSVRLNILHAKTAPSIWEFQLFAPQK